MARTHYRIQVRSGGEWRTDAVFDEYALAAHQAEAHARDDRYAGARIIVEHEDNHTTPTTIYDSTRPDLARTAATGSSGGGAAATNAGATQQRAPAEPPVSRGQTVLATAVIALAAMLVVLVVVAVVQPGG